MYKHRKKTGSFVVRIKTIRIIYSIFVACVLRRTQNWTKNNILCCAVLRFQSISSYSFSSFLWFPSSEIIALHIQQTGVQETKSATRRRRKKTTSENSNEIFSFSIYIRKCFWHFFVQTMHEYIRENNVIAIFWIVLNRRHVSIKWKKETKWPDCLLFHLITL